MPEYFEITVKFGIYSENITIFKRRLESTLSPKSYVANSVYDVIDDILNRYCEDDLQKQLAEEDDD